MMRVWLQNKRVAKGMTQDEVANQAGIKRAYYTMIENDNRNPSVDVAKKIAEILSFDWTIFYDNKSNEMTPRAIQVR